MEVVKVVKVKVVVVKIKRALEEVLKENKVDKVVQKKEIVLQILGILLVTNVKRKNISLIYVQNYH